MNRVPINHHRPLVKGAMAAIKYRDNEEAVAAFYGEVEEVWGTMEVLTRTIQLTQALKALEGSKLEGFETALDGALMLLLLLAEEENPPETDLLVKCGVIFTARLQAESGLPQREFFDLVDPTAAAAAFEKIEKGEVLNG